MLQNKDPKFSLAIEIQSILFELFYYERKCHIIELRTLKGNKRKRRIFKLNYIF